MQRKKIDATSLNPSGIVSKYHISIFCLLTLCCPVFVLAQNPKPVTLSEKTRIKIKLTRKLISGRVRIGDKILFVVAEDVLVEGVTGGELVVAIKKDTPVFGRVVEHKHKHRIAFFGINIFDSLWLGLR